MVFQHRFPAVALWIRKFQLRAGLRLERQPEAGVSRGWRKTDILHARDGERIEPIEWRSAENIIRIAAGHDQIKREWKNEGKAIEADAACDRHVVNAETGTDRGLSIAEDVPGEPYPRRHIVPA